MLPFRIAVLGCLLLARLAIATDKAPYTNFNYRGHEVQPSHSHRLSVTPLDLSRAPTTEELMAAGQLGGPLSPTHQLKDKRREEAANMAFGHAIEEGNKHEYPKAVGMFRKYLEDFPESPWAAEAALHIGCDALGRRMNLLVQGSQLTGYDSLQRLTRVTHADGTTIDYVYDALGNRLMKTTTLPGAPPNQPLATVTNPRIANGLTNVPTTATLSCSPAVDPNGGDFSHKSTHRPQTTRAFLRSLYSFAVSFQIASLKAEQGRRS